MVSPVDVNRLEELLIEHPNKALVKYVTDGFRFGFDIGFSGSISDTRPRNLLSARQNPAPVSAAIERELSRRHTSGPFHIPPFQPFHCSPLGAVPKKDGTHRIILDLSSPRGQSVNEGISRQEFSVRYSLFDEAIQLVRMLGRGCFLAKIDIKPAFRLCPVRPSQWPLLGYSWQGQYFVDTRLPFGSRSSPFIFNCFAELLAWILLFIAGIPFIIHYLDDFLICAQSREESASYMQAMTAIFSELGVPISDDKTVGPSQVVTYLGIEIDTVSMSMRLPPDKFFEIQGMLLKWKSCKKCTKRELLSLIGSLSFASKVVKPGRMFLRRLIDLSTTVSSLNHHIYLNAESRADIDWWVRFFPSWNGVCLIQDELTAASDITLFTDASRIGCGAVYGTHWFSLALPESYSTFHISVLELFAIVVAVFTWGDQWQNKQILFHTDNESIVHVWQSGTSSNRNIMTLVRQLFFFCAQRNINILMQHLPGSTNILADPLSRLQVDVFRRRFPEADVHPAQVPAEIWNILTI